jgi:hypothetical protein
LAVDGRRGLNRLVATDCRERSLALQTSLRVLIVLEAALGAKNRHYHSS